MSSPTIRDVAKLAGVSIKTVSRVVNKDATVKERNRKAVEHAVAELGYRPNLAARILRSARSYLIALLYENTDSRNLATIQTAVLQRCRQTGHHLIIERIEHTDPGRLANASSLIQSSAIEGAILLAPVSEDIELLKFFVDAGIPCVRIGPAIREFPQIPSVSIDDRPAAKAVTLKLAGLGHTRIGYVRSLLAHPTSMARFEGYCDGLAEANLPQDPALVVSVPPPLTVTAGAVALEQLLSTPQRPTAVFAHNDDLAIGALLKAEQMGLRIPEDISIFGFDDSHVAPLLKPSLSSVRLPLGEMADTAAMVLLDLIDDQEAQSSTITLTNNELILRGSAGPAPLLASPD